MATYRDSTVPSSASVLTNRSDERDRPRMRRERDMSVSQRDESLRPLFLIFNAFMFTAVTFGLSVNRDSSIEVAFYVLLLALLCSLPLCFARNFRGPHALSISFLTIYFGIFALKDLSDILLGVPPMAIPRSFLLTDGEILIVATVICYLIGYAAALKLLPSQMNGMCRREWSPAAIWLFGCAFWVIGYASTYFMLTEFESMLKSPFWSQLAGVTSVLRLLNSLGALMLAYLHIKYGKRSALVMFLIFCVLDFVLGFYGDTKEQAFRDPILYVIAWFLLRGKIPVMLGVAVFLMAATTFSFFAEFRDEFKGRGMSRSGAAEKVFDSFTSMFSGDDVGKRFTQGLEYVSSRSTLKPNVELIMSRVGETVDYQYGATIWPLVFVFIPRNLMPDKPDASVGRKFNQTFKVSADPNTYISPSQNGDLYWNFGWFGLVVGMMMIGIIQGGMNRLADLERLVTLPRLLILMMTIYLICLRFEDGIAIQYTVWLRGMAVLLLANLIIPKVAPARK
jgi:hypothetical protein